MGLGKAFMTVGKMSEKVLTGVGKGTIGVGKAIGKVGTKAGKGTGKLLTKELTGETLENASLYERAIGRKANAGGVAILTAGTMAVTTGNAILDNGGSKFSNLGYTSIGELERVSQDSSGFIGGVGRISGGRPEITQDIVKNSYNNVNQFGASGDIVFALHNMREG